MKLVSVFIVGALAAAVPLELRKTVRQTIQ
jgi:hypothetical protein